MTRATRTVFRELLRQEWRLHARLFGGTRFAPFPLLVAVLSAGGIAGAYYGRTDVSTLYTAVHVLVFGFGLYTGTAVLVGAEMVERVLGDVTLLSSVFRTLPVSRRTLIGLFVLSDVCYYLVLFVLPIALGFSPLVAISVIPLTAVPWVWVSLSLVFAAGLTLSVAAIAARTRGAPRWAVAGLLGASIVGLASLGSLTPAWDALVVVDDGPLAAISVAATVLVGGAAAFRVYDPAMRRPARTRSNRFRALERRLPAETAGLLTKTLLDLGRSTGGFAKPFVSVGLLFALVAALVDLVESIVGLRPATGVFFGAVLALSAFTTYNWLTQFDGVDEYLLLPISVADVFRAKRLAFLLIGVPAAGVTYLAALVVFPTTPVDALLGAAVLAGCALYFYGLTVSIAGFSPNEFLFDTARFLAFFLGVALPLIPLLLVGFVVAPRTLSAPVIGGTLFAAVGLGGLGLWLSDRAADRWAETYRAG
ncbi:hypothetical protein SAMN05192561_101814 [Halopenitus malekzadehii]|uniref:ABC-2 type transport system permease protein n=1 Tax=Halopenitus malekzadehii TaxID=1267564 RepID=A0A1H6I072_9EURY|nr:hypothetical protein [Halopenitus malekzadehii]SEH41689.1 hypothetical protein SAMN05192561_101814 [Halopenitus malekzadehii]